MNPLATIGIARHAIDGLSDEQAWSLVKTMYRSLALIHHPDRGGTAARFRALQQAMEDLDYDALPEQFRYWKRRLLRPARQRASEAAAQSAHAEARQRDAEDRLAQFWLAMAASTSPPGPSFNACHLPNMRILLREELENMFLARRRTTAADGPDSHCELQVDGGSLRRFQLQRQLLTRTELENSTFPSEDWVYRGTKTQRPYAWCRADDGNHMTHTCILGAISSEAIRNVGRGSRVFEPLLAGMISPNDDVAAIRDGFCWDDFRPFNAYVTPFFKKEDVLILHSGQPAPAFIVAGKVRGIAMP